MSKMENVLCVPRLRMFAMHAGVCSCCWPPLGACGYCDS